MRRLRIRTPILYAALPSALDVVKRLPRATLVYHCIDDYREFTDAPREAYELMEDRLSQLADLTVVSSSRLLELRREDRPKGCVSARMESNSAGSNISWRRRSRSTTLTLFRGQSPDSWAGSAIGSTSTSSSGVPSKCRIGRSCSSARRTSISNRTPGCRNLVFLGLKPFEQIPHYIKRFKVGLASVRRQRSERERESTQALRVPRSRSAGRIDAVARHDRVRRGSRDSEPETSRPRFARQPTQITKNAVRCGARS